MKSRFYIFGLMKWALASALVWVHVAGGLHAAGEAWLRAESLELEETEDGAVLRLEGPVEVTLEGDRLTAESAVVTLKSDAESLIDAIERINLTGGVSFAGVDGSRARAARATYISDGRCLTLRGGVTFSQGGLSASAESVEYSMDARLVSFSGGCSLNEGDVSASAETAEYDLSTRSGNLEGGVEVHYKSDAVLFGDERVEEIVLRAPALYMFVAEGEVGTPATAVGERTVIEAGGFSLDSDSVTFRAGEDGLSQVNAKGNIRVEGPDLFLAAGRVSLSTADRILRAEGNVTFSVLGQEGEAEALEVNFPAGWSIRLVGARVGGTIEESNAEGEEPSNEEDTDSEGEQESST